MGTRADFYIGRNATAEWIGSIAYDGYLDGIPATILASSTAEAFRQQVTHWIASRDDGTLPAQGWPWPWTDSHLTECSYWFDEGRVWQIGKCWTPPEEHYYVPAEIDPWATGDEDQFEDPTWWQQFLRLEAYPDMQSQQRVTLGRRSGLFVVEIPTNA